VSGRKPHIRKMPNSKVCNTSRQPARKRGSAGEIKMALKKEPRGAGDDSMKVSLAYFK
jgi:hypothetical protein